jgi:predicted amidophosphoribosyltransferase
MSERFKKYCPECRDRISRSATRCSNCGHSIVTGKRVLFYVFIVVGAVAAAFLALRFLKVRLF